jgi:hypothetical protein
MTRSLPLHRFLPLLFIGWLLVWQNAIHTTSEDTQRFISTVTGVIAGKIAGGKKEVIIRDDADGHIYPDNPTQNRGSHFNIDDKIDKTKNGNHYDYQ